MCDPASERILMGLDRARASGKRVGPPLALSHEQAEQCRRMAGEGADLRQIARVMSCSPVTVKRVLAASGRLAGLSLNSAAILSNSMGPPHLAGS